MKKLIALFIGFYGCIQAATIAVDDSNSAMSAAIDGSESSVKIPELVLRRPYFFSEDLVGEQRTSPRSVGQRRFTVKGNPHFLQPDQCMLAIVDEKLDDFEQELAAALQDRLVHTDNFETIFKKQTAHSTQASLLIANPDHLFIGVQGARSRIIVLEHDDADIEYINRTARLKTSSVQVVLLLRSVSLPAETIAQAVREYINAGRTTSETAKHISDLDPEHTVAVVISNLDRWNAQKQFATVPMPIRTPTPPPVRIPTPPPLSAKAVKKGCCELI